MESSDVRQKWATRSGEYSPAYYAHYGSNEISEQLRTILDRFVGRNGAILELGCSSGRHLAHLSNHGFQNLAGIDINPDAFDVMADAYPALAATGTFHVGAIEDIITDFDDGQFDAVYSVETLQHLHSDATWVFAEIARITGELLVTVENEGDRTTSRGRSGGGQSRDGTGVDSGETNPVETENSLYGPNDADVNYVDEGVPLYYRDWNKVFTVLGFDEVDIGSGDRDTVRTFRPTDQ